MRGILKGLAELDHEEVVHRDIKLENIMVRDTLSL
jgi:serine/threonine protein kinase